MASISKFCCIELVLKGRVTTFTDVGKHQIAKHDQNACVFLLESRNKIKAVFKSGKFIGRSFWTKAGSPKIVPSKKKKTFLVLGET